MSPNSEIADIQQAQGANRKGFEKERDSIIGANAMAGRAVANTKVSGLKGPEANQLRAEIASRTRDIENSLPALLASAQRDYKSERATLNEDLGQAIAGRQASIQEAIATKLGNQKAALQDQMENQKEKKHGVQVALSEAKAMAELPTIDDNDQPGPPDGYPKTTEEWLLFEEALRRREGVDSRSAHKAVKKLQMKAAASRGVGNLWG